MMESIYTLEKKIRRYFVNMLPYNQSISLEENYQCSSKVHNIREVMRRFDIQHSIALKFDEQFNFSFRFIKTNIIQTLSVRHNHHNCEKILEEELQSIYYSNLLCLNEVKIIQSNHNVTIRCWFQIRDSTGKRSIVDCDHIFLFSSSNEYEKNIYHYFVTCLIEYRCRKSVSTTDIEITST